MKILMCHVRYQIRGGEDESMDAGVALLRAAGHEVDVLEDDNRRISTMSKLALARDAVWSGSASRALRARLRDKAYDVVHVENFFPLMSPAIHYAAHQAGVGVVQSLRNFRLNCLNATFFRDGRVCEDCLGSRTLLPGIRRACYRGDRGASTVVAASVVAHRLLRTWTRRVDVFVTPSEFARDKIAEGGLPRDRIVVKPNFVPLDLGPGSGAGRFALYVGRLSPEKGIDTLLAAWRGGTMMPLKIIGDGPLVGEVQRLASQSPNVTYLGRQPLDAVYRLMGEAVLVVVPSAGYETFGRTVIEAYARGTPVVASRIGAIVELVQDGITGALVPPGDPAALSRAVDRLARSPERLSAMRDAAWRVYAGRYKAEQNLGGYEAIYERACAQAAGRRRMPAG
jgi:glycosyltransferase involved in cell wall biosynthesis